MSPIVFSVTLIFVTYIGVVLDTRTDVVFIYLCSKFMLYNITIRQLYKSLKKCLFNDVILQ